MRQADLREKFIQQGADPVGSTPEEFGETMRADTAKWAKIVKLSGAKTAKWAKIVKLSGAKVD